MAKEEKKKSEAWIDYEGTEYGEESIRWTHKDLVNYWKHLQKVPIKWGIKETTLLSRLMKIYAAADLGDMMQLFNEKNPTSYSFGLFYTQCEKIYSEVLKEREGWNWET